jgi:hypothetical protein
MASVSKIGGRLKQSGRIFQQVPFEEWRKVGLAVIALEQRRSRSLTPQSALFRSSGLGPYRCQRFATDQLGRPKCAERAIDGYRISGLTPSMSD